MDQGTTEWFAARCGLVTASRLEAVMAKVKTGEAATRKNYRADIVAERLSGAKAENFISSAMQWGIDNEQVAKDVYMFLTDRVIEDCGFIIHPDIKWTGASPDGLIGENGLIEIKCPNTATHIEYLTGQKVPRGYMLQMQWQMACTGRKWCDFMSFDPRLPDKYSRWIKRVDRIDAMIEDIEKEVQLFLSDVDATIETLDKAIGKGITDE